MRRPLDASSGTRPPSPAPALHAPAASSKDVAEDVAEVEVDLAAGKTLAATGKSTVKGDVVTLEPYGVFIGQLSN